MSQFKLIHIIPATLIPPSHGAGPGSAELPDPSRDIEAFPETQLDPLKFWSPGPTAISKQFLELPEAFGTRTFLSPVRTPSTRFSLSDASFDGICTFRDRNTHRPKTTMFRAPLRRIRPASLPATRLQAPRRLASTGPVKKGTWKGTAARWGVALGAVYFYNTSPLFADDPARASSPAPLAVAPYVALGSQWER